jgi:hypothetical protein
MTQTPLNASDPPEYSGDGDCLRMHSGKKYIHYLLNAYQPWGADIGMGIGIPIHVPRASPCRGGRKVVGLLSVESTRRGPPGADILGHARRARLSR